MTALPEKWAIPFDLGFSVIPLKSRSKQPLGLWKQYQSRRADRETIERWADDVDRNVGIVTGQVSNLVVLDFDDKEAEAEAKRRGLPVTTTIKTHRGRHYYFKHPQRPIRKPQGFPGKVDIQSDGKFVVAPGSMHPDGSTYEWENHPNEHGLAALPEWLFATPEGERENARTRPQAGGEVIATPKLLDELRDALTAIPADERGEWIDIGHALKTLPDDKGRDLWLAWSRSSVKFDQADAEKTWSSLGPTSTNHKAVFAKAQRLGWVNPAKKYRKTDYPKGLAARRIDLGSADFQPTEFVLDGFMPVGVSVIAGAWGAGKSTNLIPLLASVAHLAPADWSFRPDLRRHIVWVTEAPGQALDTLRSLARAEGAASWQEFKDWFHLFPAYRSNADEIADEIAEIVADLRYRTDSGFLVKPVVVLDTTAANLEIENESDNSQVSKAMASLKQALPDLPLILVGHTPKALVKADVGDLTFRGAGAWEADAAATYFLIHDEMAGIRFLALRKCRFAPTFREITFDNEGGSVILDTPWGEAQTKSYLHGVPVKSDPSTRIAAQRDAKERRRDEARTYALSQRQTLIMEFVRKCADTGGLPTRAALREGLGGKNALLIEAVNRLVEAGQLKVHSVPADQTEKLGVSAKSPPDILLPPEVNLALFLAKAGKGNVV